MVAAEVEAGPALREQDPITTLGCVPFVATMVIAHLDPALVRNMGIRSRVHHQLELMGPLLSAKMIHISAFAVSHAIMAIAPLQPAEWFEYDSYKGLSYCSPNTSSICEHKNRTGLVIGRCRFPSFQTIYVQCLPCAKTIYAVIGRVFEMVL